MPLFATAGFNEVKFFLDNVDDLRRESMVEIVVPPEMTGVSVRSREEAPIILRLDGAVTPSVGDDVYRFSSADPPDAEVGCKRKIALLASFKGVVRDNMVFVNVQF